MLSLYRHLNPDDPVPDMAKAEVAWAALQESSGTLVIIPNVTRGARSYGLIENVVTHANHRRSGFGRAILSAALDAAWNEDCYKVMLATGSQRDETLRVYAGAGFERGGKDVFSGLPRGLELLAGVTRAAESGAGRRTRTARFDPVRTTDLTKTI